MKSGVALAAFALSIRDDIDHIAVPETSANEENAASPQRDERKVSGYFWGIQPEENEKAGGIAVPKLRKTKCSLGCFV